MVLLSVASAQAEWSTLSEQAVLRSALWGRTQAHPLVRRRRCLCANIARRAGLLTPKVPSRSPRAPGVSLARSASSGLAPATCVPEASSRSDRFPFARTAPLASILLKDSPHAKIAKLGESQPQAQGRVWTSATLGHTNRVRLVISASPGVCLREGLRLNALGGALLAPFSVLAARHVTYAPWACTVAL
jgi:hypothetical protein